MQVSIGERALVVDSEPGVGLGVVPEALLAPLEHQQARLRRRRRRTAHLYVGCRQAGREAGSLCSAGSGMESEQEAV